MGFDLQDEDVLLKEKFTELKVQLESKSEQIFKELMDCQVPQMHCNIQ